MEHLKSLGWTAQLQTEFGLPEANALLPARIVAVDRDSVLVAQSIPDIEKPSRVTLSGRLRHQDCDQLAVGDWVGLHQTRIDYIYSRKSVFVRKRAGNSSREQAIAANVDLTLIVMSLNDDFSPRRAERYLLAAWDAGTTPLLILTKADLVSDAASFVDSLSDSCAGCEVLVVSAITGEGMDKMSEFLHAGQTAVLVGSSGVGKSSLVNALLGEDVQAVREIREGDAKGKHTTTRREIVYLPQSKSLLIDTPGMREFGLIATDNSDVIEQGFSDIDELAEECAYRDCAHLSEPGCAVLESIEDGELSPKRLQSYRKLLRELAYNERRSDLGKELTERRKWKKLSASYRERAKHSPKS